MLIGWIRTLRWPIIPAIVVGVVLVLTGIRVANGDLSTHVVGAGLWLLVVGLLLSLATIILVHIAQFAQRKSTNREGMRTTLIIGYAGVIGILCLVWVANWAFQGDFFLEMSVQSSMRDIVKAEEKYREAYPAIGYACAMRYLGSPALSQLASPSAAGLIDDVLADSLKGGYIFDLKCSADPHHAYQVIAYPAVPGTSGRLGSRTYCADQTGVIRAMKFENYEKSRACLAEAEPLQ